MATQPDSKSKTHTSRHSDFGPQREARETYKATRGPAARRERAEARAAARAKRSSQTQIRRVRARIKKLNEQNGRGGRAAKEVARLQRLVREGKQRPGDQDLNLMIETPETPRLMPPRPWVAEVLATVDPSWADW